MDDLDARVVLDRPAAPSGPPGRGRPPRSRGRSPRPSRRACASSRALTSMQAPVTQATGPGRVRQPAWYFRRERGINCSQAVRARLGKAPTEGCRVPSGLRRPKPTIPGASVGIRLESLDPGDDSAEPPVGDDDVGVEHEQPGASGGPPAGVDPGGEPAVVAPGEDEAGRPGRGRREIGRGSARATRCRRPRPRSGPRRPPGSAASDATSRSTSGQLL